MKITYYPPIKYRLRKQKWELLQYPGGYCSLLCNGKHFPLDSPRHKVEFNEVHGRLSAVWIDKQDAAVIIKLVTV